MIIVIVNPKSNMSNGRELVGLRVVSVVLVLVSHPPFAQCILMTIAEILFHKFSSCLVILEVSKVWLEMTHLY
jgi:hypothetical protein